MLTHTQQGTEKGEEREKENNERKNLVRVKAQRQHYLNKILSKKLFLVFLENTLVVYIGKIMVPWSQMLHLLLVYISDEI